MTCPTCRDDAEQISKCVLNALDILKQHFLMMQIKCAENASDINILKKRNEKLNSTIELLHKQQQEQRIKCSPKRRKLSPRKMHEQRRQRSSQPTDVASPLVPESQDSLNMNIALQVDDDEEETITETEPAISPYKPWSTRRKMNKRNCENERPDSTMSTVAAAAANQWLGKTPKDKLPVGKTKMSLTLRSNSPKLKQTRLHFDKDKDKDIIESSPNLYTAIRKAKNSQSLLQRSDNSSGSEGGVNCKPSTSSKALSGNNQPVFDMEDDDSFLELCPDPTTPTQSKAAAVPILPSLSEISDTSSVVMLTPGPQEIVFVDDSIDDTTSRPLNTMDFMQEAIKGDDAVSLTRLQQFEAKLIRDQQKAATREKPVPSAAPAHVLLPSTSTRVKDEPLSEKPSELGNESTKLPADFDLDDDMDEEEEEEVFPRPIAVVKTEPKQSVKERYNIKCVQCEKFIDFMGSNLNDEKIRIYLDNCRHRDDRELDNNTPDGFWNPHMVSFDEADPRNEVFVDRRFVDQRKK